MGWRTPCRKQGGPRWTRPVVYHYVVGWSDGGTVALESAVAYPERLKRVVACGANSRSEGNYADPQMSDQMPPFEDFIADY